MDLTALPDLPYEGLEPSLAIEGIAACVVAGETYALQATIKDGESPRLFGARLRLAAPSGVEIEPAFARLVGSGIALAELSLGTERLRIGYRIAPDHPHGAVAPITLELCGINGSVLASSFAALRVIRRSVLENSQTSAELAARIDGPGELEAIVRIHNAGPSTACGTIVRLRTPLGTIGPDGTREVERSLDPIAVGATAELRIPLRALESHRLCDLVLDDVQIAGESVAPFVLAKAFCESSPSADDRVWGELDVEPAQPVAGDRLAVRLRLRNEGETTLHDATVSLQFPEELPFAPGSVRVNGVPFFRSAASRGRRTRRSIDAMAQLALGEIEPRRSIELEAIAHAIPRCEGESLAVAVVLAWSGGMQRYETRVSILGAPAFPPERNRIELGAPACRAGERLAFRALIENLGAVAARDLRLVLDVPVEVAVEMNGSVEIGVLEAGSRRTLEGSISVPHRIEDGSALSIGARLYAGERYVGEIVPATAIVRAAPRFDRRACEVVYLGPTPLRPGNGGTLRIRAINDGAATARNVRAAIRLPPEVELGVGVSESFFGDIGFDAPRDLEVEMYLRRPLHGPFPVFVTLQADDTLPTPLDPIWVEACAAPRFEATCTIDPPSAIVPGATVTVRLEIVNVGDGPAKRLTLFAEEPAWGAYVCGSTILNGFALVDCGVHPAASHAEGLWFEDVAPGSRLSMQWSLHVREGDCEAVARARLAWEGGTLGVASAAAVIAPEPGAAQDLLPFRVGARLRPPTRCAAPPDTPDGTEVPATIALECDADPAACRRIAAFLEEVEYGALVTHLLTLRAFLPERFAALDESEPSPLLEFRRTWREALDRLAIKLRIPEYRLVAGDLETARSRRVTIAFLSAASSHYEEAACEASGDSLQAHLTRDELGGILERLYAAPIGSPCACDTLAALLPTKASGRPQLGRALTEYRRALRAHFGALGKLSTPDFLTSFHRPAPTELDAARAEILGALISGG